VNRDRTQRRRHEPQRAIDAARYFLIAEGGRGDGGYVLLVPPSLWHRWTRDVVAKFVTNYLLLFFLNRSR
jgi:hypothetical protein